MNPYDLSCLDDWWIPNTYGYRKGQRTYLRTRVYQLLVVLLGALGIAVMLLRPFDLPSSPMSYLLLTASSMIALFTLHLAWSLAAVRRVSRAGVQARHDYNYSLYRTLFRRRNPSQVLLLLAKQDLLLEEPRRALYALELVPPEKLSKRQLKTLYFYRAAALHALRQPEAAAQELDRCRAIPLAERGLLSQPQLDTLFQPEAPAGALLDAVAAWDEPERPAGPVLPLMTGLLVLYSGWYYGVQGLLPQGYFYRTAFLQGSAALIWLGWFLLTLVLAARLGRWLWTRTALRLPAKLAATLLLALLWAAGALYGTGVSLRQTLSADLEMDTLEGGLLRMCHEVWLDPNEYYYSQAVGPLLRRSLTQEERALAIARWGDPDPWAEEEPQPEQSPETEVPPETQRLPALEEEDAELAEDALRQKETLAIYQLLCDQGAIEAPDADEVTFAYSAKGSFYAIFQSGSTAEGDWQDRLVYDRVSENGQCDLFVYYRDRTNGEGQTDTGILEFYAVNRETLEVIPGEKTGWSDVGSQAYRDATGE